MVRLNKLVFNLDVHELCLKKFLVNHSHWPTQVYGEIGGAQLFSEVANFAFNDV